jgi:hypothetical protein
MEAALQYNLSPNILNDINRCQICLQAITISDITSTDGKHILPEAFTQPTKLLTLHVAVAKTTDTKSICLEQMVILLAALPP